MRYAHVAIARDQFLTSVLLFLSGRAAAKMVRFGSLRSQALTKLLSAESNGNDVPQMDASIFPVKLVGYRVMSDDAASDDAILRLVESMDRNRGRWKRRVCLIFSGEKLYLTDMDFTSKGVVQTYDVGDITVFCIHPVEEKVFGFLLSNQTSGVKRFYCFKSSIKRTTITGCQVLTAFACRSNRIETELTDANSDEPPTESWRTPPVCPSVKTSAIEEYDNIEEIYENLEYSEDDPLDIRSYKEQFVQQYHRHMRERLRMIKKYYQYPVDPWEELTP